MYAFGPFSSDGYKQQIRINYIEKISMKSDDKNTKLYQISKSYCKVSANSLAINTKQQITIKYIAEISIKSDAKKIKYYQISKKSLEAFGQFSPNDHKPIN